MKLLTYFEIAKIITFLVFMGVLVFGGISGYGWLKSQLMLQENKLKLELEAQRKYFELKINEVRANTTVTNDNSKLWKAELEELKKQNQELLALIKKNDEKITNIGKITTQTNEHLSLELHKLSDHVYKAGTGDENEQYFKKIYITEKTKDGKKVRIPVAWAIFYPNRPAAKKWKTGVYPLEFKTKIVQTEQNDGQWNTYVETWAENNKDSKSKGIKLPLRITIADFKQVKNKDKEFYWWAPHFNLNIDLGSANFKNQNEDSFIYGGISFSVAGYGRTKNDLTWRFLDFGISTNGDDTYLKFSPVNYNIGEPLPFINNTFVGPFVGISNKGENVYGVGLSVPF